MKKILVVIVSLCLIFTALWSINSHSYQTINSTGNITDSITKYKLNIKNVKVKIIKHDYLLHLFIDSKLVKSYPVVFGPDPVNDKTHEGDGCTPEGIYHIRDKYPHKNWSYFLWIDYPNAEAYKRFEENKKNGVIKKDASIGGEIGIHGVPFITHLFGTEVSKDTPHNDALIDKRSNWTAGCISLKTADITEIYTYVLVGSEVEIVH